uniref:Uncharacterized protein n=1 Tax=Solanum tuberosum TaxID=4113 RepID=M1DVN3_SOLTU
MSTMRTKILALGGASPRRGHAPSKHNFNLPLVACLAKSALHMPHAQYIQSIDAYSMLHPIMMQARVLRANTRNANTVPLVPDHKVTNAKFGNVIQLLARTVANRAN